MAKMSATEVRKNWSEMLAISQSEPVHLTKNGLEKAVIVSVEKFRKLYGLEADEPLDHYKTT